jgi:riboflavin kinase/FMN adenylyltransferase
LQIITLAYPHDIDQADCPPTVMALGYFDGIHKGHQTVINTAKKIADEKGYMTAVMTFFPHPSVVLGRIKGPMHYITPLEKKFELIDEIGIDRLYVVTFDPAFAKLTPDQFIDQYIIGLNVKHVVAGFDFTYGRFGQGTMGNIANYSKDLFTFTTIEKVSHEGEKISSTLIRKSILEGDVLNLAKYLGRFHRVTGMVIDGEKRGRTIGFPTANIQVDENYLTPPQGVYAVRLYVNNVWYNGVCNVGYKPTFHEGKKQLSIEVHLFDFNEDIYHKEVILEWNKRIRDEKKFESVDQLVEQISQDKRSAISYFHHTSL